MGRIPVFSKEGFGKHGGSIDTSDVAKDLAGLVIAALREEELGRLLDAEEKRRQSDNR